MSVKACYYSVLAKDSMSGVHAPSAAPEYKLAFMNDKFKFNPRNERWSEVSRHEIVSGDYPTNKIVKTFGAYPQGGYLIEVVTTMVDGGFRLFPRNQSSVSTLLYHGFRQGWNFASIVLYESKSGSLVLSFDVDGAVNSEYGGRFLKPTFLPEDTTWKAGPPLIESFQPPETQGPEFFERPQLPPYVYNGEVRAVIPGPDGSYYMGGSFTEVAEGKMAGRGPLDFVDGEDGSRRSSRLYLAGGSVYGIIPSGDGGFFVLGGFTSASGQPRSKVCKYTATGELDDWAPSVTITGVLLSGVVSGGFLYIGGSFQIISGSVFRNLVRLSLDDGSLDAEWAPNPNSEVRALSIYSGETQEFLYAGGDFTTIRTKDPLSLVYSTVSMSYATRFNLGEFDDPPEIDFEWNICPNAPVYCFETDGDYLYLGGRFTSVNGVPRVRILRAKHEPEGSYRHFDAHWWSNWGDGSTSGVLRTVGALCIWGDYLFASARSDSPCSLDSRINTLCAFSTIETGQVLQFFPNFQNGGKISQIWDMKIQSDSLFCVGTFQSVNGLSRRGAVSFNLVEGQIPTISDWAPSVNRPGPGSSNAYDISFTQSGVPGTYRVFPTNLGVFIGGTDLTPTEYKKGLCKINSDGKIDTWGPITDSTPSIFSLERWGGHVYVGGSLDSHVAPYSQMKLFRVSEETGILDSPWPGNAIGIGGAGDVFALKVVENKLYACGSGQISGQNYIARFSLGASLITKDEWNPNITATTDGFVNAIDITGDNVYLTGRFLDIGENSRENFAVISAQDASCKNIFAPLSPPHNSFGSSNRFPVVSDKDGQGALALGSFTKVKLGSCAILDDQVQNYDFKRFLFIDDDVTTICPDGSGGYFLGGAFTQVLGKNRLRIAQIGSDGWPTPFNHSINGLVRKIYRRGDCLYVVGDFTQINGIARLRAARFIISTGQLDTSFVTNFTTSVFTVIADDNWVYFGMTAYTLTRKSTYPYNLKRNLISLNGSNVGGWVSLVRVNAATGQSDPNWITKLDIPYSSYYQTWTGKVLALEFHPDGDKIFAAGQFSRTRYVDSSGALVDSESAPYLACISAPQTSSRAIIQPWSITTGVFGSGTGRWTSKTINDIKVHGNFLYATGYPIFWGNVGIGRIRSSKIARIPVDQTPATRGNPDPDFIVRSEDHPNDICSIVTFDGTTNREGLVSFGNSLFFNSVGFLQWSLSSNRIRTKVGTTYINEDHDGYILLNSDTGVIESFFNGRSGTFIKTSGEVNGDPILCSDSGTNWNLSSSAVHIKDGGVVQKIFPDGVTLASGTSDLKLGALRLGRWLFALSANKFDSVRSNQFFVSFDTAHGQFTTLKKPLAFAPPSGAKVLCKVGEYLVIAGGEMTPDPQSLDANLWGDFIDHGVPGGRKVVYYKISEDISEV